MKHYWMLILSIILLSCQQEGENSPYLSSLNADKNSPLYTTYAAALERSEFILDEGYEFHFYNPGEGIDFRTDTSGELGMGFVVDGKYIYKESDMHSPPIINTSYPDVVRYSYYPVEGVRVEADFLVQSSHVALWDLSLINETQKEVTIGVIPFLRNNYRSFEDVQVAEEGYFTFTHESYPDGWTLSHDMPFEKEVKNVFLFSEAEAKKGVFNSLHGESPEIPFQVLLDSTSVYPISGRAFNQKGERVISQPPAARMQVYLNHDKNVLLTENSPLRGLAQPSIDQQGYYRMELALFNNTTPESSYTFTYYNEADQTAGRYSRSLKEAVDKARRDVNLEPYSLPAIPQEVQAKRKEKGLELTWQHKPGLSYRVYKREYPGPSYKLVAKNIKKGVYQESLDDTGTAGYVVVAEDPVSGELGMHSPEVNNLEVVAFQHFIESSTEREEPDYIKENARVLAFQKEVLLKPEQNKEIRVVRAVGRSDKKYEVLVKEAREMLKEDVSRYVEENEMLFSKIPDISFEDPDRKMLYWSSFNMMRQVFYPAEGESSYNYYVFSREPTWGWGHGGQVFHESITMLAYAFMDPQSAMDSQRVYSERQYDNGYINYRTGSHLDEIIEHNGQLTSSAPWYAWQNWEVYKITEDEAFLKEMYQSSKRFYNFYVSNRDSDKDGLAEWGGHAVLESVRDALVAVWDEVGWPSNFEGVDINSMLVSEAKALEAMALELGLESEADRWRQDYEKREALIRSTFWDAEKGFFFNADKKDNDFTFKNEHDLKREEIIGFLPLWSGTATPEQAEKLVEKLTDSTKFWRKYGVPSLAADDPYYNDKGYWNGPVWVEWNFLIVQGLLKYGYEEEAKELVNRVAEGMIIQLKKDHNLWEFYSPDDEWAGYHKTYIWAGIINRMMMDVK